MPGFDVTIGNYTLVPNPFWGGVLFPLRRLRDPLPLAVRSSGAYRRPTRFHNVLDRPRDAPWRTAFGVALSRGCSSSSSPAPPTASTSRSASPTRRRSGSIRVLVWSSLPLVALVVTQRVCVELQRGERLEERRRHRRGRRPRRASLGPPGCPSRRAENTPENLIWLGPAKGAHGDTVVGDRAGSRAPAGARPARHVPALDEPRDLDPRPRLGRVPRPAAEAGARRDAWSAR